MAHIPNDLTGVTKNSDDEVNTIYNTLYPSK